VGEVVVDDLWREAMSDAFFDHVDNCDYCSLAARRFCAKAKALLDAAAQSTAEKLAPTPYFAPGPKAKA
jgi:hypothetical protein